MRPGGGFCTRTRRLVAPALRPGYSSGTRPDGSGLMPVGTAQAHLGTCFPMLDFPACNHLRSCAEPITLPNAMRAYRGR